MKQLRQLAAWTPLAALAGLAACGPRATTAPVPATRPHWYATWTASNQEVLRNPADSADRRPILANRTIRQIVHVSIGGGALRIRFTNEYADRPLVVGSVHVALRDTGSVIRAGTDRVVTFGGRPGITLRPGAVMFSDPMTFALPQLSDLAITMFVQDSILAITRHTLGLQTN
ncbi:MAG: SGNH/GDSL hydrolase family protein, partial [Gemmatimonadaceae bacterium]